MQKLGRRSSRRIRNTDAAGIGTLQHDFQMKGRGGRTYHPKQKDWALIATEADGTRQLRQTALMQVIQMHCRRPRCFHTSL